MHMTRFSTDYGPDAIVENDDEYGHVRVMLEEHTGHGADRISRDTGTIALLPHEARLLAGVLITYANEAERR